MFENLKPGDTVFVVNGSRRVLQPGGNKMVSRVGRKYGYIGEEEPFSLSTGQSFHGPDTFNTRANGYGFDVYPSEDDYRRQQHERAEFERLKNRLTNFGRFVDLPPDAVAAIHEVLDKAKEVGDG